MLPIKKKKKPVVIEIKKAESKPTPKAPSPAKEPKKVDLPKKPKGPAAVDKVQQHLSYLSEIESMSSPDKEMLRACYFLSFLFDETRNTTTLFPLKDHVIRKIFEGGHDCILVSYVRRGDRLKYRLTPEAEEKWKTETGGKSNLKRFYRTLDCQVEHERDYYDLYQFHIVLEPFRFFFYIPISLADWVTQERISEPKITIILVEEACLLRGKRIKMSKKAIGWTDEEIKVELQRFLDTGL